MSIFIGRTADDGLTVRQRIMAAFDTLLAAMQDGGSDVWLEIHHGDLDDVDNVRVPALAFDFGIEETTEMLGICTEYELPVFLSFRFRGKRGLDEHDVYQYYLGLIQKTVLADHNLGGLIVDIKEDSNTHTILGIEDTHPGGVLSLVVKYRTRRHNPYKLPNETP